MDSPGRAIFWGGLWCGVLDILSAIVAWGIWGISPIRIFHSIAGGLLGRDAAMHGGWPTALLGLICHFVIAFGAAAVFWVLSRKIVFMTDHPIIAGLLFGELVFLFMRMVVLPLSALHTPWLEWTSFSPWPQLATGILGHPFFVGLPISLSASRYSAQRAGAKGVSFS